MHSSILIIANGRSVLSQELESIVHKFPVIGRINNYQVSGFEKYIGKRTDIWFNGANQNLKKRVEKPEKIVVLIPQQILLGKGDAIHRRICKRLAVKKKDYELVPRETMIKYESMANIKRLTTGSSAILWGLDNFEKVIIHGFDFFIDSKKHYNENKVKNFLIKSGFYQYGKKHDMEGEKFFIERLLEKGKLHRLTEFV